MTVESLSTQRREHEWLSPAGDAASLRARVLIVEDEALIALNLEQRLLRVGHDVVGIADNHDDAIALFQQHAPDLVLMDISIFGPSDGIETAHSMARLADVPVIFLTAYTDDQTVLRATAVSPYGYLLKPFDDRTLSATIKVALWRHAADVKLRVLAQAVSSATIGILLAEVSGDERRVVFANDTFCAMSGNVRESLLGQPPRFPTSQPEDPALLRLTDAVSSLTRANEVLRGTRADGSAFWATVSISPVHSPNGSVSHLVMFFVDTTRERQAQDALLDSQRLQVIGQFSAMMTHDLNNILAIIQSYTELARESIDDEAILRDLEVVSNATQSGTLLTRRLLEFSRHGNSEAIESADLTRVVRTARRMTEGLLGPLITLDLRLDPEPMYVALDSSSLGQILMNLVANARDAMPDGGKVSVTVTRPGTPSGEMSARSYVRLTVSDTGSGIDADLLPQIFEPFFTTKSRDRGTGLGLSTCRMLVERAGGVISVASALGEGTTVTVDFPLAEGAFLGSADQLPDTLTAQVEDARCLLIEDHIQLRRAYSRTLRKVGFDVIEVATAKAAIRALSEFGDSISLVVSEAVLPDMPVLEVIRQAHANTPKLPFIIVSGGSEQPDELYRSGVSTLYKPFPVATLARKAVDSVGAAGGAVRPMMSSPVVSTGASINRVVTSNVVAIRSDAPTVLVVEDQDLLRHAMADVLRAQGYLVFEAGTHQAALAETNRRHFDVALIDVHLPDATGFETLTALRKLDALLPIIILSGDHSADVVKQALRGRAQGFLSKPVQNELLLQEVDDAHREGQVTRLQHKLLMSRTGTDEMLFDLAATERKYTASLPGINAVFQPIIRSYDHSIFGYEALMRSTGPFGNPLQLITASDALGRIEELGRAMRTNIAKALQNNPERYEPVFVNLHPMEFRANLLTHYDEPLLPYASRIILEVTERAQLTTGSDVGHTVAALRDAGYRIALDDLGEGYAGLSWLVKLVPDIAKIDMSLVRDIQNSRMKRELVSSLVSVCRRENTLVVAEGVETREEADLLREIGCDLLQGFYFARPAPTFLEFVGDA